MTTTSLVNRIIDKGVSKARLARLMNTSPSTVHLWTRGVYQPDETSRKKLTAILEGLERENGNKDKN